MIKRLRRLVAISAVAFIALPTFSSEQESDAVERGRYLATVGDCEACHTAPGGAPFAGGVPIETPFGTVIAANITPDKETGIGAWSDAQFLRALHEGVAADGSRLYPAFPYQYYARVTTDDLLALRAYLNTLEPVKRAVQSNQLPFPFKIRALMRVWNFVNFTGGEFKPNAAKSAEWNRGAYIVEGLGHCGACHTPKTFLGGDKASEFLKGGRVQAWFAPNIGSEKRRGMGSWPITEIVGYLKTGISTQTTKAAGPMAEVVEKSTSKMEDADLKAIAVYLKDASSSEEP
ncbi:MAG: hypothetical protein NVSMB26_07600 [Beijerinckiaceae bacterium]